MKKRIFILICLLGSIFILDAQAQQKNTLIESKEGAVKRQMNLFGELGLKIMAVKGDVAPAFNAQICLGFTEKISVGIGFQNSLSNLQPEEEIDQNILYNMYFGSIFFEYNWNPNSVFSISTPIHLGAGINKLINETGDDIPGLESDKIIAITPSVKGNINLSSKVSINIGIGYRIMGLISEKRDLTNRDFSGIESGIGLRYNFL